MTTNEERLVELGNYGYDQQEMTIEATSRYLNYETGSLLSPTGFADREAFPVTRFVSETEHIAKLVR